MFRELADLLEFATVGAFKTLTGKEVYKTTYEIEYTARLLISGSRSKYMTAQVLLQQCVNETQIA